MIEEGKCWKLLVDDMQEGVILIKNNFQICY